MGQQVLPMRQYLAGATGTTVPFGIRPSMPRPPIYKRWTETEDEVLKRLWAELPTLYAIARRMRRSESTVRQKGAALGLPPKEPAGGRQKRDDIKVSRASDEVSGANVRRGVTLNKPRRHRTT